MIDMLTFRFVEKEELDKKLKLVEAGVSLNINVKNYR